MTPERVAFYAEQAWPAGYEETSIRAIERAIRQAVNEALSEVEAKIFSGPKPFTMAGIIEREVALSAIRALKLPEEP